MFFRGIDGEADVLQNRLVSSKSIYGIGHRLGCDIFAGHYLDRFCNGTGAWVRYYSSECLCYYAVLNEEVAARSRKLTDALNCGLC